MNSAMTARLRPATILTLLLLGAGLMAGCQKKAPTSPSEVMAVRESALPATPEDAAWKNVPEHLARLILQDLVEPRLLTPSTPEVRVQAITNGTEVAFRLEWADATLNDLPGAARFSDACAVQFPTGIEANLPAPQMGEAGRGVEITVWKAAWQAVVDGRGDTIKDLYPNATVDHYPFEAHSLESGSTAQKEMEARYAPARALGNHMAGPRTVPVENLLAEGPGTITTSPTQNARGCGHRTPTGWAVVIVRPLPGGLTLDRPTQVAFAVWEGSKEEVGARKMRTGWIPLAMEGKS